MDGVGVFLVGLSLFLAAALVLVGIRRYSGGFFLFRKASLSGLVTVEEHRRRGIRVMKRSGKTLSGIELSSLRPTANLYWYPHLVELFVRSPERVLCFGGGACAYPTYLVSQSSEVSVDVVENDPVVIEAARKHFPLPRSSRFQLIQGDALIWARKKRQHQYDLIFLDVGIVVSRQKLVNQRFLKDESLKAYLHSLGEGGTLAVNVITTRGEEDQRLVKEKLKSFGRAFRSQLVFLVTPEVDREQFTDMFFLFTHQRVGLPFLSRRLKAAKASDLSYPKPVYRKLLRSSLRN